MEWINAKERLPEAVGKECVLCINGGGMRVYKRWGCYRGNGIWFGDGGFLFSIHDPDGGHNVTHWMPLPDPPGGGGVE